ncbi:MAG: PIN domain-containing protein [Deltaproteobacteria bacterium]|nr:PIN domain-containing protein [Deltaproteobacteria bacterium]
MKENFRWKTHGREVAMPDKVLIDTSIWVEFFRKKDSAISKKLQEYLKLNQVYYSGPIFVELYQGAKTQRDIEVFNQLFDTIHYVDITRKHYHHAGMVSQKAAREGKIFSTIDVILAVLAHDEGLSLFSLDRHFQDICHYCPLNLIPQLSEKFL